MKKSVLLLLALLLAALLLAGSARIDTAGLLDELVRGMPPAKADKFRAALRKALQALADQMEGGA